MAFSYEQRIYQKVGASVVGVVGAFLLQYHAVQFFAESFWEGNLYFGIANSLFFEAAAVGLWSLRKTHTNILAFLCTCMVLFGPLYQISMPLLESGAQYSAEAQRIEQQLSLVTTELESKQHTFNEYLAAKRYPQERKKLSQRISELTDTKARLLSEKAVSDVTEASGTWQMIAKIVMQLIGVVLTQIVVVMCVRFVAEKTDKRVNRPETWAKKRHATEAKKSK